MVLNGGLCSIQKRSPKTPQNTSEANCIRAYKGLSAKFEVRPEVLACAREAEIREAIRSGGLYNVKAKRLKELSKSVLEKFGGDLTSILSLPKEEARKKLMELPGIGPKTADVLLSSRHGYSQVFVVDTHMDRIAKRLGLVKPDAKYEEIQVALKNFIPWDKGERIGGLFWLLAKYTCKAQNPKCQECPIIGICDYGQKKTKSREKSCNASSAKVTYRTYPFKHSFFIHASAMPNRSNNHFI